MTPSTKRACDACHRRKVRCNSSQPCGNCSQAGLLCTYDAIPQKKGPKGSRAKVISELRLRETQKQSELAQMTRSRIHGSGSPPTSPAPSTISGVLTLQMIDGCTHFFFAQLFPTMPILQNEQLGQWIADMNCSVEAYCLLASLCAFVLIQPGIEIKIWKGADGLGGPSNNTGLGIMLLEEAQRVRKAHDYIDNPTIASVMTSFFLFGCCFGLNKHNAAWFHLREATASAQLLGMQEESYYLDGYVKETSRKRRLFWLLFITERAYALQKHRPLTLHATIELPKIDDDPSISVAGFIYLVQLYHPFDDMFIGLWNKSRSDCSTFWLAQLQQQLTQALPVYLDVAESQAVDLRTSQQWLRTMVWQLSITNGYLSSTSSDSSMTFGYPIEIAKDLVTVIEKYSKHSMEVHGVGLIEKVFDIACTLIDVMSCVPIESRQFEPGPRDHLNQLITLISTLRGGESRYLPLLRAKIEDTLPAVIPSVTHSPTLEELNGKMEGIKLETYSNSSNSSPHSTPPYIQFYPLS